MLKIVAVMLVFAPGMSEPKRVENPVASFEECQAHIKMMVEAVKPLADKEFKALFACQVSSEKSGPA